MPLIQLRHHRNLGYTPTHRRSLPLVPDAIRAAARSETVVTFRPLDRGRADQVRRGVHGCTRFIDLPAGDLTFLGVEGDSPLAPLLLWDAAHFLPVGRTLTLIDEGHRDSFLQTAYFRGHFTASRGAAGELSLRKLAALPAERDSGLDRWTFGIPVGPEDATLLNVVVARILALDIPDKEILLCGRPHANFRYWDQVRIMGEDITAPPVQICKKKNRLAQEARFENLCLLHDRVLLPSDFGAAVRRFGDRYPLVGFQSLFFDDRWNLIPRRYSDAGVTPRAATSAILGVPRDNSTARAGPFTKPVLPATEKAGYYYASPMRYSPQNYLTGSLYLAKRSVWLACPQDENLFWTEFEDVEQGLRAARAGIPSRINPHSLTQSLISRPLLSFNGMVDFESASGEVRRYRPALEPFPFPRKPLLKVTQQKAIESAVAFRAKYGSEGTPQAVSPSLGLRTDARLATVYRLLNGARLPIRHKDVLAFAKDVEKLIVLDQLPEVLHDYLERDFLKSGNVAARWIVDHDWFVNHTCQRPSRKQFAQSLDDYLVRRGVLVALGCVVSACLLQLQHRKAFFLPGFIPRTLASIWRSTPFADLVGERSA